MHLGCSVYRHYYQYLVNRHYLTTPTVGLPSVEPWKAVAGVWLVLLPTAWWPSLDDVLDGSDMVDGCIKLVILAEQKEREPSKFSTPPISSCTIYDAAFHCGTFFSLLRRRSLRRPDDRPNSPPSAHGTFSSSDSLCSALVSLLPDSLLASTACSGEASGTFDKDNAVRQEGGGESIQRNRY